MSNDRIEELLRQADRAAGAQPAMRPDLAGWVRQLARHRRTVRITGSAVAALVALAVGTAVVMTGLKVSPAPIDHGAVARKEDSQDELARLRAEIEQLRADTRATLTLANRILARQEQQKRLAELRRVLAQPDPMEQVQRELDQAAFIIVYQADRMYRELNLHESAIESYRQAIKLFPQTRWADVARERLAEIERPKGDQL